MRRWTMTAVAVVAVIALAGCDARKPLKEGAQLTDVPEGFMFDPNMRGGRPVFQERTKVRQRGYMTFGEDVHGSIMITEYAGTTDKRDAERARAALATRYPKQTYDALHEITLDGRPAWAWFEETSYKGRMRREYKAVVSYDDVTYTIEFSTNDPHHRERAFMEHTVGTFVVASTKK